MKSKIIFENENQIVEISEEISMIANCLKILARKTLNNNESMMFEEAYDCLSLYYENKAIEIFSNLSKIDKGKIHICFVNHMDTNLQDVCEVSIY